jgi:hypothetical protein
MWREIELTDITISQIETLRWHILDRLRSPERYRPNRDNQTEDKVNWQKEGF